MRLAPELIANFVAPYLVYELLEAKFGDVVALIASALPPLIWSGYELIKTRRLDAISVLVLAGIVFTLVATAMGGSARLIQIRDALVTGVIGLMFLGSLLLEKPMIFYLARATQARNTEEGAKEFETMWLRPAARATFRLMTGVWGAGLVLQTALMCWLAWTWPIGRYLLLSPFISYAIFGGMMAWSFWYGKRRQALAQLLGGPRAAPSPSAEI